MQKTISQSWAKSGNLFSSTYLTSVPAKIKSAWPDLHVGKDLTDRRIAYYQKRGYYSSGMKLPVVQRQRRKRKDVNEGIFE
jgi:hypothetical protein